MDKLRNYEIAFSGLKNGKHEFQFEIDQAFFQLFEAEQEFTNPRIIATVLLDKHTTFLEFWIKTVGPVTLICDLSNDNFDYSISNEIKFLVNFGEEFDDSNEEVITIPHHDHAFNVAQIIYENIVLAIPMKKISPECNEEDLELLDEFNDAEEIDHQEESNPIWDALKKLKDKN